MEQYQKNNIKNMVITIGISEENRQAVSTKLAKILADETVLYIKTKNAHWNIEGIAGIYKPIQQRLSRFRVRRLCHGSYGRT